MISKSKDKSITYVPQINILTYLPLTPFWDSIRFCEETFCVKASILNLPAQGVF